MAYTLCPTPTGSPQTPRLIAIAPSTSPGSPLVVVMFGHCALLLVTIDAGGLRIGNLLGELPEIAPPTWVVQVMPLFFLAGGRRGRVRLASRYSVGHMAFHPGAATVQAGVLVPRGMDGRSRRRAHDSRSGFRGGLGRECVALLWFLGIYLVVTFRLLSPLEHRRLPWWDAPARATGVRSTAAGVLICVAGVALVALAKNGLTGFAGWPTLGCFIAAAAAARLSATGFGAPVASAAPKHPLR